MTFHCADREIKLLGYLMAFIAIGIKRKGFTTLQRQTVNKKFTAKVIVEHSVACELIGIDKLSVRSFSIVSTKVSGASIVSLGYVVNHIL